MKKLILLSILYFSTIGCNREKPNGSYKYYDGYHIGDLIEIPSAANEIRHDTIFRVKKPIAKFVRTINRIDDNILMQIESFETGEKGLYIKK